MTFKRELYNTNNIGWTNWRDDSCYGYTRPDVGGGSPGGVRQHSDQTVTTISEVSVVQIIIHIFMNICLMVNLTKNILSWQGANSI